MSDHSLRRMTLDHSGVVTINMRASQILVFWSSFSTLVPVEAGWYLYAASVAGRSTISEEDGESHDKTEFDLKAAEVRWQHARISSIGRADLSLEKNRRYVFYITPKEARREDLLDQHLPWPCRSRSPQSKDEPAVLVFLAWPLELDHHCDLDYLSGQDKIIDPSLMSFDSWEHDSTAEAAAQGKSVQAMIDMWAFRGLIDGGAMLQKQGTFENWQFWCPHEESGATPMNPYALPRPAGDPMQGVWHCVIPEKDVDPDSKAERPWTAGALKNAMRSGRAAALTIGEIIMLAADCYTTPDQMTTNADRWKNSVNIMRIYWEARQWLDGRKKLPATATGFDFWQGYQQRHGVVYVVFELLLGDSKNMGQEAIEAMDSVAKGVNTQPANAKQQGNPYGHQPAYIDPKVKQERGLRKAFEHLTVRARRVDAMVDFLRQASGPSLFTEIMFLAQTLGMDARGKPRGPGWVKDTLDSYKGLTLGWMKFRLPWLANANPQADLAAAGFTNDEIHRFETQGINDQLAQFIVTNGRYADLALNNHPHFSENGLNVKYFEQYLRKALAVVGVQCGNPSALHPIPAQALFLTAFACHFLTDAFSASHMRVPRKRLGPLTSKLMHDIDGQVGLWVYNSFGNPFQNNIWYAFGDTFLHTLSQSEQQQKLLPPKQVLDPEANFYYAADAVGSAFKQLHYQAYSFRQADSGRPVSTSLGLTVQVILDANGPIQEPGPGMGEQRSLDNVFKNEPTLQDLSTARYLRWETLSPGAGGRRDLSIGDRLSMTEDERIAYMNNLVPVPLPTVPPGTNAPESRSNIPSSIHEQVNIPRLYSADGQLISGSVNSIGSGDLYDIVTSTAGGVVGRTGQRLIDGYKGFVLRVNWGPFGDSVFDSKELRLNFDAYYFLTKFFKDVQGLETLMDPKLIDVYNNLNHETS